MSEPQRGVSSPPACTPRTPSPRPTPDFSQTPQTLGEAPATRSPLLRRRAVACTATTPRQGLFSLALPSLLQATRPRLWEANDSPPRPPRLAPRPPGFSMCRTGGFAVMIGMSRETGYPRGLRLTLPYVPQCGARSLKAEVLQRSACRLLVPGSAGMAPFTPTACKSARPAQASASCFGSVAPPAAPLGISIWMSQRRTGVDKPSGGCRRPCCSRPIPVTSSTACDLACRSHQKPAPPSPRGPSLRLGTVFQLEAEG